jgi:uncharacterized membrane protein YqiK
VREKNRDALAKKLAIEQQESFMKLEQEQQVKTRTAEQSARIAAYEAERHQEAEQSRIAAERQVQESEIQREQAVRTRKVEAEREVRVKEIEQTKVTQMAAIEQAKVTEIAAQDKAIVIASKSEAQSQAQARANEALAEAVKAEQLVETTRRTAEADRAKQVALIEAAQQAETSAVHVTTQARSEREAAQMQATAIVELAEAARKKGLAEAEAQRALNDAINALSSDQTSLKFKLALLQALPAVIQQTVEPMKAIDGIKIVQVDGLNRNGGGNDVDGGSGPASGHNGTNLAEQAMSAALAYRAHAPLIDSLLHEVGLSGGSLQGLVPGLAAVTATATGAGAGATAATTPAVAQHTEHAPGLTGTTANGTAEPNYGHAVR